MCFAEGSITIQEQLAQYSAETARLRQALDLAFGQGTTASTKFEDRVVFPLGVACKDILGEILFAAGQGYGRLALRSARTMYECAVFARYLSLHPAKTQAFLNNFHASWAMILRHTPEAAKNLPGMHSTLSAKVPGYAAGKHIDLDWSGKKTWKMAEKTGPLSKLHSLAFNYASAFVHPNAIFVLSLLSNSSPGGDLFHVGLKPQDDEAEKALRISHDLALNAIHLRLKYSPSVVLGDSLEECKKDFVRIWSYPPHL